MQQIKQQQSMGAGVVGAAERMVRPRPAAGQERRLALHGLAVQLQCQLPDLEPEIERMLGPFSVPGWPDGFSPVVGSVVPFDAAAVQRAISPHAVVVSPADELIELYRDGEAGERFWVVDERWGMAELNLLKRQWRSWVLPRPRTDSLRCTEMAVLWPLAQLLRLRGLTLVPAVAVSRGRWGGLILCPFNLEPELSLLLSEGYKLIGQRWTALREEDGRIAMLHLPGVVERTAGPRQRGAGEPPPTVRVDLSLEHAAAEQNHAFCDTVLIATPGRRAAAAVRELGSAEAVGLLRRCWPIIDLQPDRHTHQLPPKLGKQCRCAELQLSRDPSQLLAVLERMQRLPAGRAAMASLH